jgi:replicative DNA helicase
MYADQPPVATLSQELVFHGITSKELDENDYELTYLVDGILVRGQPGVIAGPKKTLKTNISIDLALSLSHAGLFLGRFNVSEAVRVGVMSAESGAATIQETARRIGWAKHWSLEYFENVVWCFDVPQLDSQRHMEALRDFVVGHELEALILDPTYMMMLGLGENASNLFVVGGFLKSLGELAQETGCTPVMCHHLRKRVAEPYEPAELEDIAWAGFQEFVRQWILLNRRVKYDPDSGGHHELWMSVGGSAGHSGLWGINIDEGTRQDADGRQWDVEVTSAAEAYAARAEEERDAAEQRRQRQHNAKLQRQREAVLEVLRQFPDGETPRVIREHAGVGAKSIQSVLDALVEDGEVVPCTVKKNTREEQAYRLVTSGGPGGP